MSDPEGEITAIVAREQGKLRGFIRKWVPEEADVEDILQDVFYELVEARELLASIQQVGAWMYRVARNRMTDLFRKRQAEALRQTDPEDELGLEAWLPSAEEGPEAAYARRVLLEALEAALDELPPEQREAFVAHEIEGLSFKELAASTGVPLNTLLSRKRYAVLHLRQRLKPIYEEHLHD